MGVKTSIINKHRDVSILEKYIQVIPKELLEALKESAIKNGLSLNLEIDARLTAYMSEPNFNKNNSLFHRILDREFSNEEAMAECKRKREAALFVYEMEKLRLFLRFEQKLPRNVKEAFSVIDVKEASIIIKKELELEKAQDAK